MEEKKCWKLLKSIEKLFETYFLLERNLICMLVLTHSLFLGYFFFVCYFSLPKHPCKYWGIKFWLKCRANEDGVKLDSLPFPCLNLYKPEE